MTPQEREDAIRSLFPLVRRIAERMRRMIPNAERDDLTGDGCIGAIKAVDTYDPQRGVPLDHYAGRVIVGAMLNGLRLMDRVPERVRREMRAAERERYTFAVCNGRMPTQAEMAERRPSLRRAETIAARLTPLSYDNPLPLGERFHVDWSGDPLRIISERSDAQTMRTALKRLPERQRMILTLHYMQQRSLRSIGESMRISPQRVSQLHLNGIKRLRKVIDG